MVNNKVEQAKGTSSHVKVATAALIGTAIEWFDFFIYGTATALVFNKLFFPTLDPLTGTLAAYGTFAMGFVARPVGGFIFGHYGDRIGRKKMLYLTLLIMGSATFVKRVVEHSSGIGHDKSSSSIPTAMVKSILCLFALYPKNVTQASKKEGATACIVKLIGKGALLGEIR